MNAVPLFRDEVLRARTQRLHGEVGLIVPLPWQAIGYLLLGALLVVGLFLANASYARVETVAGSIEPDQGVASVVGQRAGVVARIMVREGQRVRAGTPLAVVRIEDSLRSGEAAGEQLASGIEDQDGKLQTQIAAIEVAGALEASARQAQLSGLRDEIASLATQIAGQERLIVSSQSDADTMRDLAEKGLITRRDMRAREDELTTRQQHLAQLRQLRSAKQASLVEATRSLATVAAQTRTQAISIESDRLELSQRLINYRAAQGYTLRAPIDGVVTSLTARIGSVTSERPLMSIVPVGATLRAELLVPTQAAGQIEHGQEVRLAIDAFPYQRFGTITGTVEQKATATVTVPRADGGANAAYRVVVALRNDTVDAFGRRQPLLAGMTLSARIVLRRQTLLEWLFEPIFAVGRR